MRDDIQTDLEKKALEAVGHSADCSPARGSTAPVQCGDHFNELKVDINNKMMMYAPETMTIKEADEIACAVVVMITLGKWPVR